MLLCCCRPIKAFCTKAFWILAQRNLTIAFQNRVAASVRDRAIWQTGHSEPIWCSITEMDSVCFWPNKLQKAMLIPSGSGAIPGASRKLCQHVSAAEIFAQACLGILVQRTKTVFGSFNLPSCGRFFLKLMGIQLFQCISSRRSIPEYFLK